MAGDITEVPERVGRYEILLPIAKGGMATVYLARAEGHGGFDRYVALKLTLPHLRGDPEFAAHLLDEAKLVAHIRHTNVVPVLDVGQDKLGVFLVMDYVPGDTLSGLIRAAEAQQTKLPTRVALRVLIDALEGLHAAHEHGDEDGYPLHLVHRDFSPQNILVGTDGVGRLTDFGIAKAASRISSTAAGLIKGKMSYVSPEQAAGSALDRRCDLWAAGIIAWEIMCDRKLTAPNDHKSLMSSIKREPPRIRTIVPDAPEAIEAVIASVLKLERDDRLATAALLARDLSGAARSVGLLAETHEVAEHVKRLAGPVLAERKAHLATARRIRIGSIPDGVLPTAGIATTFGLPSPLAATGSTSSGPAEDDLSIVVIEGSEPPPALPQAAPAALAAPAPEPTTTTTGVEGSIARVEADEPHASIPGLERSRPNLALIGAALGGLVLIILVVVTLTVASGRDAGAGADAGANLAASAMAATNATGPTIAIPTAIPTATATATAIAIATDEPGAHVEFLALSTNAPVAEVRVGNRVIDMVIAAPNVNVELEPDETTRPLVITLKSVDGRIVTKQLPRGQLEAEVVFGDRAAAPRIAAPTPPNNRPQPPPLPPKTGKPPRRP